MANLARIQERVKEAGNAAFNARQRYKETGGESRANLVGYYEGRASAFNEAEKEMRAMLARLKNKFQNGGLSMDDFQL